jgi:hypothetical protein
MIGDRAFERQNGYTEKEYGKTAREVVQDLYDRGTLLVDISYVVGVSYPTIKRFVVQQGWRRKLSRPRKEHHNPDVIRDRSAGMTWAQLREKYGMSFGTLQRVMYGGKHV